MNCSSCKLTVVTIHFGFLPSNRKLVSTNDPTNTAHQQHLRGSCEVHICRHHLLRCETKMSSEKSDDFDLDARLKCSKFDSTYLDHMFLCIIGFVKKRFLSNTKTTNTNYTHVEDETYGTRRNRRFLEFFFSFDKV